MSGIYIPNWKKPESCDDCWAEYAYEICNSHSDSCPLVPCDDVVIIHKSDIRISPTTNADRIRSMSDEELAKYFTWLSDPYTSEEFKSYNGDELCEKGWLDWLKQEAADKDGADDV